MNLKRLYIFLGTLILTLIITLIESQFHYIDNHPKTRMSIQVAEVMTFAKIGWMWFLPLIVLTKTSIYNKPTYRILLRLSPIVIMSFYYWILWSNQSKDLDYRLFAGYYYRYPYYFDIILSSILTLIPILIIMETRLSKNIENINNDTPT